ncbi:unnamed protein product [Peronospora farinosa]|uniref:Uncharacterized protein n=1 Tax=Peronospora farinosa TaxID=134698 RepID=A0AAV0UPR7_9STRA|nr:unnamed protein product [Peronospora farinosa]
MDLSEIPFGVPVILQSIRKNRNLQNPLGSKKARCLTDNRDIYEQLVLHRVRDDKIAIQSGHNGRFLQVCVSGECVFDPTEAGAVTTIKRSSVRIKTAKSGEAWRIVEPRFVATTNQTQRALDQRHVLAGKDRQHFVLELAKCGKTPQEIEQIVTSMFDDPADSAVAVPVAKE